MPTPHCTISPAQERSTPKTSMWDRRDRQKRRFLHSGGTHSVSGTLRVGGGGATGATGLYQLSGGQLTAANLLVSASGTFSITNATAGVTVTKDLTVETGGAISAAAGSLIRLTGATFTNQGIAPSLLDGLGNLTLLFKGGPSALDPLEVAGQDYGAAANGWFDNFAVHDLLVGGEGVVGRVQLVNTFDNRPAWTGIEALYVDDLLLGPGSYLDLNGLNLYYKSYSNSGGTVALNGGHLVAIPEPGTAGLLIAAACHRVVCRRRPTA